MLWVDYALTIIGFAIFAFRERKPMATLKYIVVDKNGGGWATEDPIEGWIFTRLRTDATTFDTEMEAKDAIKDNYPGPMQDQLLVSSMIVED
jgi:hypothetical protein